MAENGVGSGERKPPKASTVKIIDKPDIELIELALIHKNAAGQTVTDKIPLPDSDIVVRVRGKTIRINNTK